MAADDREKGSVILDNMAIRQLPDLSPDQVTKLQDALLENADGLLTSALALYDIGHTALARSLAILGLEESGKAIAVHRRRIEIVRAPEGEVFRCDWLDDLWASHVKKLETVHQFLVDEPYWFDTEAPDPEVNATTLGTVRRWKNHDRLKQRGFYVDLGKTGEAITPRSISGEASFREVIARVHQIGWQLRLGEHIEGVKQFEQERGIPAWDPDEPGNEWIPPSVLDYLGPARPAEPGKMLTNSAYRFNAQPEDANPFTSLGKPGHEAETRELIAFAEQNETGPDQNRSGDGSGADGGPPTPPVPRE
ncbi:MAG: AbiV family abortive infection protein [Quadrisphaera sp.]